MGLNHNMTRRTIPCYLFSCLLAAVLVCGLSGCTGSKKDDKYAGMTAYEIFSQGEQQMAKKSYSSAIKSFEALEARYPFGPYIEQAQMNLIYAYYRDKAYPSAAAAADRYIHLYPRSPHVDYAYYMKGLSSYSRGRTFFQYFLPIDLSQRDLTSATQAFQDFTILINRFPESPYNKDARQRMIYLRNLLAQHEINVAEFYMRRRAYVAAANRASYVVRHYQGSPHVIEALGIMVQAYTLLNMKPEADAAMLVLKKNYPNSSVYQKLVGKQQKKHWL